MNIGYSKRQETLMSIETKRFANKLALVTGASSGIGQAIAQALTLEGAHVHAVARSWPNPPTGWHVHRADLAQEADLRQLAQLLNDSGAVLDLLIHSAGVYAVGDVADFSMQTLDHLYQVNVRAPFLLTQLLLPSVIQAKGQIVFINSSSGIVSKGGIAGYSATKFAIKSIADALRAEVNDHGVRVMSVYPGKTASPMQAQAHVAANRAYHPDQLMQPADVAQMVLAAVALPATAEMTDVHIRPMKK